MGKVVNNVEEGWVGVVGSHTLTFDSQVVAAARKDSRSQREPNRGCENGPGASLGSAEGPGDEPEFGDEAEASAVRKGGVKIALAASRPHERVRRRVKEGSRKGQEGVKEDEA